jgi:hypothetical protein
MYNRNKSVTKTVTNQTVTSEYETVTGEKCYGRQAVACSEFDTRPEPLNATDQPVPLNRGRYIASDGQYYQFDAVGNAIKCSHEYRDKDGKRRVAAYKTLQDVAVANESRRQGMTC